VRESRDEQIAASASLRQFLKQLASDVPGTAVFDPFESICPPVTRVCSNQLGSALLYSDDNHLTNAGALLLHPAFQSFLSTLPPVS
jgi:hypothetical protein